MLRGFAGNTGFRHLGDLPKSLNICSSTLKTKNKQTNKQTKTKAIWRRAKLFVKFLERDTVSLMLVKLDDNREFDWNNIKKTLKKLQARNLLDIHEKDFCFRTTVQISYHWPWRPGESSDRLARTKIPYLYQQSKGSNTNSEMGDRALKRDDGLFSLDQV